MRNHKLSRQTVNAAKSRDLGGTDTAVSINWKSGTGICNVGLKCAAPATLLIVVLGLLPLHQALADPGRTKKQLVPVQSSTIPTNGDLNPYGVAFVPDGFPSGGLTQAGDILVSNFNNNTNAQGTGTTIVTISPDGKTSLFFQGSPGLGLTTALGVLKKGFVIVGNLPTDSMGNPLQGSLLILDRKGMVVSTLTDSTLLDGPWDLAILENGTSAKVFVSCVLNGTVTRLDLAVNGNTVTVKSKVTIASGYKFGPNAAALVVGPTGLAYDSQSDVLYVASTDDNKIFAVNDAGSVTQSNGTGTVIYSDKKHLHGPLGLLLAPNGHLISSQGDAINPSSDPAQQSEIVEFTKTGVFVGQFSLDSAAGAAFGIAINSTGLGGLDLAAVNDATNALSVFELSTN